MATPTSTVGIDRDPAIVHTAGANRATISAQLMVGLRVVLVTTVLCGLAYPLAVLGISQTAFSGSADGSLIERNGAVVGSALLAQAFTGPEYFHPRPSAAGDGYDGLSSAGSNLGPSNPDLAAAVEERAAAYRDENGLPSDAPVPVDAVTASGSGLDPEISPANARLQAERVAAERGLPASQVRVLVDDHTTGRFLGVLGEPGVNVLELNLALDEASS